MDVEEIKQNGLKQMDLYIVYYTMNQNQRKTIVKQITSKLYTIFEGI